MNGNPHHKAPLLHRRVFVGNTFTIVAFGSLLMPLAEACTSKKSPVEQKEQGKADPLKKPGTHVSKKTRKKWSHESLVMNTKTKVLHFPSSKMYTYYDEIKAEHLQPVALAAWAGQLNEQVRFHKQQSGNILEVLSLRDLQPGINDATLTAAAETLTRAFSPATDNAKGICLNSTNFRLHELLLQLVALNNSIPVNGKWNFFSSRVKKPAPLRKRQQWMESEERFLERVNYILNHQTDYTTRLTNRAAKYRFT